MSSVGTTVYNISDVHRLSFGKVVEQVARSDGWTWYKIEWVNNIPTNAFNRNSYDPETGWFRCDTVKPFELEVLEETLGALK